MKHQTISRTRSESLLATHQVLRNTYFLLGLTILFSAFSAWFAMSIGAAPVGWFGLIAMFGLLFLVQATANSIWGLPATFLFTGFMGYILGPTLNYFMHAFTNGGALITTAFGATGIIFLALSSYVLATRKDFSYMGGFLFVGVMIAFMGSIAAVLFSMPLMHLIISGFFTLICSGLILFHTSNIINGGERNYILATISLYIALYNIFVNLLHIFAMFAGNRD
jgi:modulator of FtsH protease